MAPPATVTVYRHGLSAGVPGTGCVSHRGTSQGWSLKSSRENTKFLYSVVEDELTGYGLSLSLTVRECPPTHEDWVKLRRRFLAGLERLGAIRFHWLTEWQRRGVPHLHGAVWFPDPGDPSGRSDLDARVLALWIRTAAEYRATYQAQAVSPIWGVVGWLEYLSKHGARGQRHYQRAREAIPAGWRKTGRMWGYRGSWALQAPLRLLVDRRGWFLLRRAARGWLKAQARAKGRWGGVRWCRRMLKVPERHKSEVRGIGGWVPMHVSELFLSYLVVCSCGVVKDGDACYSECDGETVTE